MPGKYEPYLLIAVGGFAGACVRYSMNETVQGMFGILLINVIGCYLLGFLMYESIFIGAFSPQTRLVYGAGFIGSFTTFSTFSVQTLHASPAIAILNVAASLILGFGGVFLGRLTAAKVAGRRSWKR